MSEPQEQILKAMDRSLDCLSQSGYSSPEDIANIMLGVALLRVTIENYQETFSDLKKLAEKAKEIRNEG